MIRRIGLFILIALATSSVAFAGTINGTLQEDFSCPAGNCTTSCVGPGGPQTITGYKDLSAWMVGQPDRLWLQTDNGRVIVLGVGDRCTFAGTPYTIGQPPEVVPLPPVNPGCTCIGNVCNPPGCKKP
jgi:hypothetical protein